MNLSHPYLASPLRAIVPLALALLLLAAFGNASQVFRYREQTGREVTTYLWRVEPESRSYTVIHQQGEETFRSRCTEDGATLHWRYTRPPDTDVQAERSGDRILLSGRFEGEPVEREVAIDTRPWFQPLSFSLQRMLTLNLDRASFWTIRPDTLDVLAMQAEREGSETIGEAGEALVAERVAIRLDGLLAGLWRADYWFRQGDRLFVQYRGAHGPPGTAETVVRLMP